MKAVFVVSTLLGSAKALAASSKTRLAAKRPSQSDRPPNGEFNVSPDPDFVQNPFHDRPGFGGDDALRCICQNPDEILYPDGHADDDDEEFDF